MSNLPTSIPDQPTRDAAPTGRCNYCSEPATIHAADGVWCTAEHQAFDRQSETTVWRRWAA